MVRIDEGTKEVVERVLSVHGLSLDEADRTDLLVTIRDIDNGNYDKDPGDYGPIDLCQECYTDLLCADMPDIDEVDHPSYWDLNYFCFVCGKFLDEDTDG